jgi:1-acyl-sn-glycerol-3-phosphate acyltransferase
MKQNHLAYSDYYLVQALASRKGMLGRCRYFVKREIVRIPFFGWAFWVRSLSLWWYKLMREAIGMILVSRDWTSDASLIE